MSIAGKHLSYKGYEVTFSLLKDAKSVYVSSIISGVYSPHPVFRITLVVYAILTIGFIIVVAYDFLLIFFCRKLKNPLKKVNVILCPFMFICVHFSVSVMLSGAFSPKLFI